MIGMHLDAYFNVASSCVAVGSELLLKAARVEVFCREGAGVYRKMKEETNLHDYIKQKGFEIINITALEQIAYASNFLCIKDSTILAVEVDRIVKTVIENLASESRLDPERYGVLLEQVRKDYQDLKGSAQFFPHKKEVYGCGIDAFPINLKNLTGGYGGAHCMTCPLERG
jgi:arginine deiminase